MYNIGKKIVSMSVVAIMLCCLCACGKQGTGNEKVEDIYDASKDIVVDVVSSNGLCFNLDFFTKKRIKKVKCIGISGNEIDSETFKINVFNNTIDVYSGHKYKGLYCSTWMFELMPNDDANEYEINAIELDIDGKIKKVVFEEPMKLYVGEGNDIFGNKLQMSMFANEVSSSILNSGEYMPYKFVANNKLTLEEIYAKGGLKIDTKIYLNGNMNEEYTLPLELEAGTSIDILISYNSDKISQFDYVLTNLYMSYTVDGITETNKGAICFSPTSPVSEDLREIDAYIDYITSK